jgi:hypothetical protein
MTPCWGELTFSELDSRTCGIDRTSIGLATPGAVVCATAPDEWGENEILLKRRGDDSAMFVEWLLKGTLIDAYSSANSFIDLMMGQLFVEASINECDGEDIAGSYLIAGRKIDEDQAMCAHDSSEWRLSLNLEPLVIDAVLDLIARCGPEFSEIVTAARDPESPSGIARRTALDEWESVGDLLDVESERAGPSEYEAMGERVASRRNVYRGDIPGDPYEGRWPTRLTIYAESGPDGFTLTGIDSVEWPDRDMHWTIEITPEHAPRLREALFTTEDASHDELLELVAARFEDGTISVRNSRDWFNANGIEHTISNEFYGN